jgi:hypothetical protein
MPISPARPGSVPFLDQPGNARILRGQLAQEVLLRIAEEGMGFPADERGIHLLRPRAHIALRPDASPFGYRVRITCSAAQLPVSVRQAQMSVQGSRSCPCRKRSEASATTCPDNAGSCSPSRRMRSAGIPGFSVLPGPGYSRRNTCECSVTGGGESTSLQGWHHLFRPLRERRGNVG